MSNLSTVNRIHKTDQKAYQEQKNYQDFINTTNQWLQRLTSEITEMKKTLATHVASVDSRLKSQEISIQKLHETTDNREKAHCKTLDMFREEISNCKTSISNNISLNDKKFLKSEEHLPTLESLSLSKKQVIWELSRIERLIQSEITRLSQCIMATAETVKKEVLSQPTLIPSIQKSIEEKDATDKANYEGIMQKLAIMDKATFISQKNIENLYTQLERIKAGKK